MASKSLEANVDQGAGVPARYGYNTGAFGANAGASDEFDIRHLRSIAIQPPTGCTQVTMYASIASAGTFALINDLGTNGVVSVTPAVFQSLDITKIAPYGFIKIAATGGSTGTGTVVGKS